MFLKIVNFTLIRPLFAFITWQESHFVGKRLKKYSFLLSEEESDDKKFSNDLSEDEQIKIIEEFNGNPEVFEKIYNFYYEMIFKYLVKRTMSAENAYDITADTFLKAFENFGRFKWQGFSIKIWLYRIAINNLKNYRRGKLKNISPLDDVPEGLEQMSVDAREELKELDKALFGDEEIGRLSDAISALNPKYKKVLSLYYFSKMSQKEIAETMNKSTSSIKSMTHRAITNLRQLMEPIEV